MVSGVYQTWWDSDSKPLLEILNAHLGDSSSLPGDVLTPSASFPGPASLAQRPEPMKTA